VLDRPSDIEARLRDLDEAVIRLSERVSALEAAAAVGPVAPAAPPHTALAAAGIEFPPAARPDLVGVLSLVGRTLIVFGGAYLLRALTESGRLPARGGVLLGLLYALVWLGAADRAAGARRPLSSLFHGLASVAIGLPLIWEAAARFQFFRPLTAAGALAGFTAIALGVAWRRRLQSLAALTTIGAIVAMAALAIATTELPIFTLLVVLLGAATWGLGEILDWHWLSWPPAAAADVLLVALIARATATPPLEGRDMVVAVLAVTLAAWAALVVLRTLVRRLPVRMFDLIQTAALLAIGLTGTVLLARAAAPALFVWAGALCLCAAAAAHGAGFGLVWKRAGSDLTFYFYTTTALVLGVAAAVLLLDPPARALVLAAAALVTIWLGSASPRGVLAAHGAVYATAAALASTLLASAVTVWIDRPADWPVPSAAAWVTLAVLVACVALGWARRETVRQPLASLARLVISALTVIAAGGVLVMCSGPVIAGMPPQPGVLATLKTAYLAGAAVLLALAGRRPRWRELGWLAYPVLILGGIKLVTEDLAASRPATLFIAFALYGTALVATSRLAKPRTAV
jgi:hypothetical protein